MPAIFKHPQYWCGFTLESNLSPGPTEISSMSVSNIQVILRRGRRLQNQSSEEPGIKNRQSYSRNAALAGLRGIAYTTFAHFIVRIASVLAQNYPHGSV